MRRQSLAFWLTILAAGLGAGALYNLAFGTGGFAPALVYGVLTALAVAAFERGLVFGALRDRIRRLPALLYVPAAELAYAAMIAIGNAAGGLLVYAAGLTHETWTEAVRLGPKVLLYSLAVSAALVFVIRMKDLIGGEVFVNLLIGRYHRPVSEDRIFLFLDLEGSTRYAQVHGDLAAQAYLGAIFAALADPVQRHRGSIDDYIGDMAMITWPVARGAREGRCIACVFAVLDGIARDAALWRSRYGEVPRLRAALHGGPVVMAEVGVDRHKIAYFGDVVNTTARIEALCRTLDAPVLISADLLARIDALPPGIRSRPLGDHVLHGRGQPLGVAALEREGPAATLPKVLRARTGRGRLRSDRQGA